MTKIWAIVESETTRDIFTDAVWWIDATVEGKEVCMLSLLDNKLMIG